MSLVYSFPLSTGYANFTSPATSSATFFSVAPIREQSRAVGKYSIFEIANWFLSKEAMAHKKLQKLCYYAQAWFITLRDIRLSDAIFEAWVHGPVSPALYERFKQYGYSTIRIIDDYLPPITEEDIELLENVWQTYGEYTGNALEALSHSEQPWIIARNGYAPNERCSVPISLESMKAYYEAIYIGGEA
jgi:uncharacterized phage-associated protein